MGFFLQGWTLQTLDMLHLSTHLKNDTVKYDRYALRMLTVRFGVREVYDCLSCGLENNLTFQGNNIREFIFGCFQWQNKEPLMFTSDHATVFFFFLKLQLYQSFSINKFHLSTSGFVSTTVDTFYICMCLCCMLGGGQKSERKNFNTLFESLCEIFFLLSLWQDLIFIKC